MTAPKLLHRAVIVILVLISIAFVPVFDCPAQTSLNAPPEDPVYSAIDILIANGLVKDVVIGQRPYSRTEVARILKAARVSLSELSQDGDNENYLEFGKDLSKKRYLNELISFYEKQYKREIDGIDGVVEFDAIEQLEFAALYNSSDPRTIPPSNGIGTIDGVITSFDQYDQGLTLVDGANSFIRTRHNLYLTKYSAFTVVPRFDFQFPRSGNEQISANIQRLYAKGGWKNIELEAGRDNLYWGQGADGGLMLSTNPRPLDMVKLTNPYPWRMPSFLKYLGSWKFTLFVSNLGPQYDPKYPYFYGLKLSLRPSQWFEFGLSHTLTMGGDGAPAVKWWQPITEIFPIHKWGNNLSQTDIANNAWGFLDFRLTIPPLRGTVLYYDGYIEDSIVRAFSFPNNLLNQMAFIGGLYVPRLTDSGSMGLRFEYHHTAPLTYRHGRWVSGYTLDRRVIGDAIGPTADAMYATYYWRAKPNLDASFNIAYEDYDSSLFRTEINSQGGGDRILKDISGPHERRYRAIGGVEWRSKKRIGLKGRLGYEKITNANFDVGHSANNLLTEMTLTLYFDDFNFKK